MTHHLSLSTDTMIRLALSSAHPAPARVPAFDIEQPLHHLLLFLHALARRNLLTPDELVRLETLAEQDDTVLMAAHSVFMEECDKGNIAAGTVEFWGESVCQ